MATYLQGVTDYIPDYQPFQPDFNFYANVLQTKQNQYDKNYNELNNIYSDIINAPLTHNLNKEKKDVLLRDIDNNLKKVTNLDLSLQQNVQQATQVFRPFYEDKYLMKDMAYTKNAYNVLARANSLQNSQDEKLSSQWWPQGIKAINYQMQDFADATLEETLGFNNVKYTPYINSVQHYMDMAKKLGIKAQSKYNVNQQGQKDPYGDITITARNGQQLIPTLNQMFIAEYAKNPKLQDIYRVRAYVERKDWINQHLGEYGSDKNAAEKAYLEKQYNWLANQANDQNKLAAEDLKVTKQKSNEVEDAIEAGNVNPKQKKYLEALASGATVQEAILMSTRKLNAKLNDANRTAVTQGQSGGLNLQNMDLARMKVDAGMASQFARADIGLAAQGYSTIDAVYEQDLSKLGLERIKNKYKRSQIEYENTLKAKAKAHQKYIDWGIKNGKFQYKAIDPKNPLLGGTLVNNDDYDKTFERKSSDPGSTTEDPIDLAALNAEMLKNSESAAKDPFYDALYTTLHNLVKTNAITKKELNQILTDKNLVSVGTFAREMAVKGGNDRLDPNSAIGRKIKEMSTKEFYMSTGKYKDVVKSPNGYIGTLQDGSQVTLRPNPDRFAPGISELMTAQMFTGQSELNPNTLFERPGTYSEDANEKAFDKFQKMYETWTKDKTKGRSMMQNTFAHDGWENWLIKNAGSTTSDRWLVSEPKLVDSRMKFEQYLQLEQANEKIYDINSSKVMDGLKIALTKKYSDVLDEDDIHDLAEYYKEQYFDGAGLVRKLGENETAIQDGRELEDVDELVNIDGTDYAGPDVESYVLENILPKILEKNAIKEREVVGKIKKGTDWNETKGLSSEQWEELNRYIDNDATMQSLERQYGLESEPELINTADYWDIPRASGYDSVSDYRDELAAEWKKQNNTAAGEVEQASSFANDIESVLDEAYNGIVYDPNKETGLITMINGISSGAIGGKASLASNFEDRYVNMQDPQSQGFRDFQGIIQDLNKITFNQVGNYRVSTVGLAKPESQEDGRFKHDLEPNKAVRLVETLFQNAIKAGSKIDPIKISNSRIAMEDRNTNAITIFPSRKFLEENIKSVPYQNYEGETDDKSAINASIDNIMSNGITFIAPKNEWANEFITTNKETPLEMALNALGEIEYQDPYNAGSYIIQKIDGVPGVTHQGIFTLQGLMADGTIKTSSPQPLSYGVNRNGSTLEDIQRSMMEAINAASMQNQMMYKKFVKEGNEEAIANAEKVFGMTPSNVGFNYND
tara:strand:- start:13804 stop:17583 length:3780 start_codon:yes stop_codon:yes gene_type:complete